MLVFKRNQRPKIRKFLPFYALFTYHVYLLWLIFRIWMLSLNRREERDIEKVFLRKSEIEFQNNDLIYGEFLVFI